MDFELNLEGTEHTTAGNALVASGGKLPHSFLVSTSKLLDVIVALSPRGQKLTGKQRQVFRQTVNKRLYNKTRPGFYLEVGDVLHIAYAGQPAGANTQHQWRIFYADTTDTKHTNETHCHDVSRLPPDQRDLPR